MNKITVTLTEDQIKQILHALHEWVEGYENYGPAPGLEKEVEDLIAFNKRLINKLAQAKTV